MTALRRVVRALRTGAEGARGERVPPAQLFLLQQLADSPAASVNELAARTLTDQSSVSVIVAKLAARGLVTCRRAPADARRKLVALTPAGRRIARRAPSVTGKLVAGLARMPERDRKALARHLEAWVALAGLAGERPELFFES